MNFIHFEKFTTCCTFGGPRLKTHIFLVVFHHSEAPKRKKNVIVLRFSEISLFSRNSAQRSKIPPFSQNERKFRKFRFFAFWRSGLTHSHRTETSDAPPPGPGQGRPWPGRPGGRGLKGTKEQQIANFALFTPFQHLERKKRKNALLRPKVDFSRFGAPE